MSPNTLWFGTVIKTMRYFKPVEDTSSSGSANGNEGADKEPTHMGEVHQAAKVRLRSILSIQFLISNSAGPGAWYPAR